VKKKLLYITSRFPFPLEKGDKLRAFHQIKFLSKEFDIYLVSLSEKDVPTEDQKELLPFLKELKTFKIQGNFLFDALRYLVSDKPLQLAYFHSTKAKKYIHDLVEKEGIDVCFSQLIRTAELSKELSIPKVMDYMDAFSEGFKRQSQQYFGPKSLLYKLEGKRIASYESSIRSNYNNAYIISEQDKNLLNLPLSILKNGIDSSFRETLNLNKEFDLCFVGNMSYPPNVLAAEFLVKQILPLVQIEHPNAKLLIAGAKPNAKVKSLESKSVKVSGWMEDIRQAYSSSKIFVAPLFIGTGLQNKLLEAMAQGLPCITTELCNNALQAIEGEQILISNTRESFAENIISILNNPDIFNKQIASAKGFIKDNYDWDLIGQQLSNDLQSLI